MVNATQELNQKVCQKYGWSAQFDVDTKTGNWFVDVTVGLNDTHRFVAVAEADAGNANGASTEQQEAGLTASDKNSMDATTRRQAKRGMEVASTAALLGLQNLIQQQESKPQMELCQVFPKEIPIYDSSNPQTWEYFWNHVPTVVGIDTEGNQKSPPVLVQIAVEEYCILEIPQGGKISANLQRLLLREPAITKIFCDNFSHRDKLSLGIPQKKDNDGDARGRKTNICSGFDSSIVDLEVLASDLMGPSNVARGLARITTLCMPELGVSIQKPKQAKGQLKGRFSRISRYAMIEQGKAKPLKGLWQLSSQEQQYAALDAWVTLETYKRLKEEQTRQLQQATDVN